MSNGILTIVALFIFVSFCIWMGRNDGKADTEVGKMKGVVDFVSNEIGRLRERIRDCEVKINEIHENISKLNEEIACQKNKENM